MTMMGLVGGLGPESGAWIYLYIVRKYANAARYLNEDYTSPRIVLWTVPVSPMALKGVEQNVGCRIDETCEFISEGIEGLRAAGATVIGIPCNTVHAFFSRYRPSPSFGIRLLNIVEETVKVVKDMKISVVGILGTHFTIESGLYATPLTEAGVNTVFLSKNKQDLLSRTIVQVLSDGKPKEKMLILKELILSMNVSTVILGCTELPLMIDQEDIPSVRLINTLQILGDALVLEYIDEEKRQ